MPRNKSPLEKVTMNFRQGDMAKIQEMFPEADKTVIVRKIIASFVDKHYTETTSDLPDLDTKLEL